MIGRCTHVMNMNNVYKNCNNTYIILLVFIIFKETLRETA